MYSDHLPCGLDTRLHFLLAVCLQVTVSILAVLGAVYTGFRVNGFLRRSGGLCCELHVRSCHSHLPFPSFLPLLLFLPPSSPLSLLPPLSPSFLPSVSSPSSLFFSSPIFLSQTFVYMMVEVCSAFSTAILILLVAACTFWLIFFKVRHAVTEEDKHFVSFELHQ